MNPAFWQGKTVLVTGHSGFKGGWLSLWLSHLGARVIGYALAPPTVPSFFTAARIAECTVSLQGDIRDGERLSRALARYRPEIVLHLAAQPLVRASYRAPAETFEVNVMGTVRLLEVLRGASSVRVVVVVTSDKCYENREQSYAYREDDPMGGYDPYSSSKGCAELVVAAYRRSFYASAGVALASARAGNVIGGGDWAKDRLVVDVMKAFMAGEPVQLRHPQAVRPWQHVLEPLAGYLLLAERLWEDETFAEAWNFGPPLGDAKPVAWVASALARLWGGGAAWQQSDGEHPHEARLLMLDAGKARSRLGWTPRLRLEEALAWTVAWYRAFQRGEDMRAFSEGQLKRYQALVAA